MTKHEELQARIALLLSQMTKDNAAALLADFWYEAQAEVVNGWRSENKS